MKHILEIIGDFNAWTKNAKCSCGWKITVSGMPSNADIRKLHQRHIEEYNIQNEISKRWFGKENVPGVC